MIRMFLCIYSGKKILFDISVSTEFLSTQMRTFLANLFQNSLCKSHARRLIILFGHFSQNRNILTIEFTLKT